MHATARSWHATGPVLLAYRVKMSLEGIDGKVTVAEIHHTSMICNLLGPGLNTS